MAASYRVLVQWDPERSLFVASAPELEHCTAEGATRGEALGKIEEEIAAQLANMREQGATPPAPLDEGAGGGEHPTGEVQLKLSKTLHRELAWQARVEGVDLSQLAGELLGQALDLRKRERPRRANPNQAAPGDERGQGQGGPGGQGRDRDRGRGPREGQGGRYHAIMEDRATFLEYVRGLDQGGGGPGRGGGGGRRGR